MFLCKEHLNSWCDSLCIIHYFDIAVLLTCKYTVTSIIAYRWAYVFCLFENLISKHTPLMVMVEEFDNDGHKL